ncbi:hypothetical protein A0J61_04941 [Choanephora cucurbitarum]|uniref:Uncharacterized protein n=1 Tax=Choanephora cucurbitarum TaxID=101091 RepID=A0A1C7NDH9_9FUNG|nr:hypothetical protein A0J61_04941 [Choanephora cucurbitarum]
MRFITVSLALVAPFLLTSSAASIGRRDEQKVSAITGNIGYNGQNGANRGLSQRGLVDSPGDNSYNPSDNVAPKSFDERSFSFGSFVHKRATATDSTEQDEEVYIPPTKRDIIKSAPTKRAPATEQDEEVYIPPTKRASAIDSTEQDKAALR